jgi:hypothetical protein
MKNLFKKSAIVGTIGVLFVLSGSAKNYKEIVDESTKCLELSLKVTGESNPLTDVTITVYNHNKVIAQLNNDILSDIKIALKKNLYYIMEVSKPGYITRSVIISTNFPAGFINNEEIVCRQEALVSLVKQPGKENKGNCYADNPISVIYYDAEKACFAGSIIQPQSESKQNLVAAAHM